MSVCHARAVPSVCLSARLYALACARLWEISTLLPQEVALSSATLVTDDIGTNGRLNVYCILLLYILYMIIKSVEKLQEDHCQ